MHVKIGRNVKLHREKQNFTQLELAHAIGHKTTTIISLAEIGKTKHFNIEQLYKISKVLKCDICAFFD